MARTKESLISETLLYMDEHLSLEQLQTLNSGLAMILNDYFVGEVETSLAVVEDDSDIQVFNMFFIAKKIAGLSTKTLAYYRSELRRFLAYLNKPIIKITTNDIRHYLVATQMQAGYSNVTLNNKRRIISTFFAWLTAEEYIAKNPMLRVAKTKEARRIMKPFTGRELELLRVSCVTLREKALFEVLISSGMRVGEMARLTLENARGYEQGSMTVIGKGNKERYIYLNDRAVIALQMYLDSRKDNSGALFYSVGKSVRNGVATDTGLSIAGIADVLNTIAARAGVSNVHPHRFRRTAATMAAERGMPVEQIQRFLGHESINTTMLYVTISDKAVRLTHEKLLG